MNDFNSEREGTSMIEAYLTNILLALGGIGIFMFWGCLGLILALLPHKIRDRIVSRYIGSGKFSL